MLFDLEMGEDIYCVFTLKSVIIDFDSYKS